MKHSDFTVGCEFYTPIGLWRCTDVGGRTVVAILIEPDKDPGWYNGPPYAVNEVVFDEYDIKGCARGE